MSYAEMIDQAEVNIRADYRAGTISKEQFQKELLIVARARQQELGVMACHFRTHRECACKPGECHQQPRAITAPVSMPSLTLTFSAAIVCGAIISFFVFVSMPRAMEASHRQQLENQEQIRHG